MMNYDAANISDERAAAMTPIAPNGDVTFIVGPEGCRLRVFALFVMTASPVLDAMLGPNFKERHRLTQVDEAEIALPEDNAEALKIIFTVIHGHNDMIPTIPTPGLLLQIAIAADKYNCFTPLTFAVQVWLESAYSIIGADDPVGMWALAMAALIFGRHTIFAKATAALIMTFNGSYLDLVRKDDGIPGPVTQLKTAVMLEMARTKLLTCLMTEAMSGDWHCTSAGKKNRHQSDWLKEFVHRTGDFGQRSISDILVSLNPNKDVSATDGWAMFMGPDQIFKSISDRCRAVHEVEGGLCLRCARDDEVHEHDGTQSAAE